MPGCERLPAGDEIDLDAGCAGGVCADMTLEEIVAVLGDPDDIDPIGSDLRYEWPNGVYALFDDEDEDGVGDPDSEAGVLFVGEDFAGADPAGLGPGASLSCFVEDLGEPDDLDASLSVGAYHVEELKYDELYVRDEDLDGVCDKLDLF